MVEYLGRDEREREWEEVESDLNKFAIARWTLMIGKHLRFSFNFFDHVVVSCANSSAEEIWISIFFSSSHCSTVFVSHDEKFNYLYSLCWDLIHFISIFSRLRIVQHTESARGGRMLTERKSAYLSNYLRISFSRLHQQKKSPSQFQFSITHTSLVLLQPLHTHLTLLSCLYPFIVRTI